MHLTPLASLVAQMDTQSRKRHGKELVRGRDIGKYTTGVCYEAAAFVRFALGANIRPDELVSMAGNRWLRKFDFLNGKRWDGRSALQRGAAVGFYRPIDKTLFHVAIATGGCKVRAVNGGRLGTGWQKVNLRTVLGEPDEDGAFAYDRTKIEVWVSNL